MEPNDTAARALHPADPADVVETLAWALRTPSRGRRPDPAAIDVLARVTAERLVEHLRASGFVVSRGPGATPHGLSYSPPGRPET